MSENQDIEQTLNQADLLIERRRFDAAREQLAAGLQIEPANTELLFRAAYVDYLVDDYEPAEAAAKQVLELDPGHPDARWVLHRVFKETGRLAQAEEVIIGLLRDYPEADAYYVDYSHLMLMAQNFDKAKRLAEEALRLDPEGPQARLAVALCKRIEGDASVESELADLIRGHPESASILAMVAGTLAESGRCKEALPMAQALVRAYPDEPAYIDFVVEMRKANHWTMKPLWPMQKWGWGGSAGIWILAVLGLGAMRRSEYSGFVGYAVALLLVYVAYSWLAPPLLEKWLRR